MLKMTHTSTVNTLTLIFNERVHLMSPGNSLCLFRDKIWSINLITYYYYGQVVAVLADSLEKERKQKRAVGGWGVGKQHSIQFMKAGQTKTATQGGQLGLSHQATSWEMKADLRKKLFSQMWFKPALDLTSCYGRKSAGRSS